MIIIYRQREECFMLIEQYWVWFVIIFRDWAGVRKCMFYTLAKLLIMDGPLHFLAKPM